MDFSIELIDKPITFNQLKEICNRGFGNMVKGVVDVEKKVMVLGAEMHFDEEQFLLEQGSRQQDLWGINLRPELPWPEFVEFDSMINLRPSQGNRSRGVEDENIKNKILEIIKELVV